MSHFQGVYLKDKLNTVEVNITDPENDGLGGLDVFIQDQFTGTVDLLAMEFADTFTLASDAIVDALTITVTGGHTIATGQYIILREGVRYSQFEILNVVTNTITVDSPIDFAYTAASATGENGSANMGVDGSSTPVIYAIKPNSSLIWDITRVLFVIESSGQPDSTQFGDIAGGVTNGIVLRQKNSLNFNQFNCKTNGDFAARAYDISFDDRASPLNDYFFRSRRTFGGTSKTGVVLRLFGTTSDELQVIIQDDLTTLLSFRMVAQGHIVE